MSDKIIHLIPELSRWIYLGPGDFRGLKHTVTSVDAQEVTTISDPLPKPFGEVAGMSWLGSPKEFLQQFGPIPEKACFFKIFG